MPNKRKYSAQFLDDNPDVMFEIMLKDMEAMTPEQLKGVWMRAGIINEKGELTHVVGGTGELAKCAGQELE